MRERRTHLKGCHWNQGLDDRGWDNQEEQHSTKREKRVQRPEIQRRPVWLEWGEDRAEEVGKVEKEVGTVGRIQGDPPGLMGHVKCGFYSKCDGQPLKVYDEKNDRIFWWFEDMSADSLMLFLSERL